MRPGTERNCGAKYFVISFFSIFLFQLISFTPPLLCRASADDDYIFEDASEFGYELPNEEDEEVFFHRGKFINVGARSGIRFFTGALGDLYDVGPEIGIFGAYFFTFSLAGELAFDSSFHRFKLRTGESGTVTLLDILLRLKYYPFSETTLESLAYANPYLSLGVGEYFRLTSSPDLPTTNRESAFGVDLGLGGEIPVSEHNLFLGLQTIYHWIFFGDESRRAKDGTALTGDAVSLLAVLTYNF